MKSYLKTILTMLLMSSMIGCYTPKKALKELNKALDKQPNAVAEFTRKEFPCIDLKNDTVTKVEYEFLEVACPGVVTEPKQIDTIFVTKNSKPKTYYVEKQKIIAMPSKTIYITKTIEDSAKIKMLSEQLSNVIKDRDYYEKKQSRSSDWIKWLLIALGCSVVLNILFATNKR